MKKIINGRSYDTDKAQSLAFVQYSFPSDFNWFEETLFQKKTGEYFLYGEGGPNSKYSQRELGNTWTSGAKIIPLTLAEAKNWAEQLDGDEYERLFGDPEAVEEAGEKVKTSVTMDSGILEFAKTESSKAGMSLSSWLEMMIKKYG